MSFVFVPPPPSAKAQRLARELTQTIETARRSDPNLTVMEINHAIRMAQQATGGSRIMVPLFIGVLVALLLGLVFFFLVNGDRF